MGGDDFQKGHRNLSDEITEIRNNRINSIKSKQEELDNLRESVLGQEVDYWFKEIRSEIFSRIRLEETSKIVFSGEEIDEEDDKAVESTGGSAPLRVAIKRIHRPKYGDWSYHWLTFFHHHKDAVMWDKSKTVSGENLYAKDITAMQIHEELIKRLKSEGLKIKSQWTESSMGTRPWENTPRIHYELQIEINF